MSENRKLLNVQLTIDRAIYRELQEHCATNTEGLPPLSVDEIVSSALMLHYGKQLDLIIRNYLTKRGSSNSMFTDITSKKEIA